MVKARTQRQALSLGFVFLPPPLLLCVHPWSDIAVVFMESLSLSALNLCRRSSF